MIYFFFYFPLAQIMICLVQNYNLASLHPNSDLFMQDIPKKFWLGSL